MRFPDAAGFSFSHEGAKAAVFLDGVTFGLERASGGREADADCRFPARCATRSRIVDSSTTQVADLDRRLP